MADGEMEGRAEGPGFLELVDWAVVKDMGSWEVAMEAQVAGAALVGISRHSRCSQSRVHSPSSRGPHRHHRNKHPQHTVDCRCIHPNMRIRAAAGKEHKAEAVVRAAAMAAAAAELMERTVVVGMEAAQAALAEERKAEESEGMDAWVASAAKERLAALMEKDREAVQKVEGSTVEELEADTVGHVEANVEAVFLAVTEAWVEAVVAGAEVVAILVVSIYHKLDKHTACIGHAV